MPSFQDSRGTGAGEETEAGQAPETPEGPAPAGPPADDAATRLPGDANGATGSDQVLRSFSAFDLTQEEERRRFELLHAAVGYAQRGLLVIPVHYITEHGECSCGRGDDCHNQGKHPIHKAWPDLGTSDLDKVAYWWREDPGSPLAEDWHPLANIGIVTGPRGGVFVLDVDPPEGEITLAGYEHRFKTEMPVTRVHSTGSGGTHYFFRWPGFDIRNSARRVLGKGLDIRGHNGFVVAPPSLSLKGPYEVAAVHDIDPEPAPGWLLEILQAHDEGQRGTLAATREPITGTGYTRKYAEAAVAAEAAKMREAQTGERNDTLNQCAFALGTLGGAGLLTEDVAWQALFEAARAAGLSEGEIRQTFHSGWNAGLKEPRHVQWRALGGEWPIRARNDFGLADRMADHWGGSLAWVPERKTWFVYAGGCWTEQSPDTAEWYAQAMLRNLDVTEGEMYDDEETLGANGDHVPSAKESFLEWAHKIQTLKSVSTASRLSKGLPAMRISQGTFNPQPWLLNTLSGAVHLRTGELTDHDPNNRMTLQAPVSFIPMASAPRWEEFLERVQPDPEMRAYLQRVAGYSMTGLTDEQVIFLHHGATGANGKSVYQDTISQILGSYAQSVPVETLMHTNTDGRVPNDVARMMGKRYLSAAETRMGKMLDEQLIKQLTGGDLISARFMRSEFFDFRVIGKIHLTTNHLPQMSDDDATWRRIRLIPWTVQIPVPERIAGLADILVREEAEGILWWLVKGALDWARQGLNPPPQALRAIEDYRRDEDPVGQFVEACLTVLEPEHWASGPKVVGGSCREIWHFYTHWARENGMPDMKQPELTARLKKRYSYKRSNGWTGFEDLRVRADSNAG